MSLTILIINCATTFDMVCACTPIISVYMGSLFGRMIMFVVICGFAV